MNELLTQLSKQLDQAEPITIDIGRPMFAPEDLNGFKILFKQYLDREVQQRAKAQFVVTEQNKQPLNIIAQWLCGLHHPTKWLMLHGTYGTGKTTISRAIKSYLSALGKFSKTLVCAEIFALTEDEITMMARQKIVLIDDMGKEGEGVKNIYGNKVKPVSYLLEKAYNTPNVLIVATTNHKPSEMGRLYGNHLQDRFREKFLSVEMNGKSFR